MKYHIIHFIVKDMEKQLEIDKKKVKPKQFQIYQRENLLQLVSNFKFSGAPCKNTFPGPLDQVAADWQRV